MSQNHPLPSPPAGQQQQRQQRPGQHRQREKSSAFSFHSHKSSGSVPKVDLSETHEEKESRRLQTKADPSMAITEAEPSAVAREGSSLAPIRAIQHRDGQGNPISDPDRSNPTRSRWERPLDTIRSFEAAVDGNYSRKSYIRTESADSVSYSNRRSSYYGGNQDERPRYSQYGYYGGGRSSSYRPESTYMDGRYNGITRPDSYYNNGDNGAGPSNGYYPNRTRYPRTASEPRFGNNGAAGVYPPNVNPQSYETVTTGSGSSGDPVGYLTDPSSENSSVDRVAPLPPTQEPAETYGFTGFGNNPQYLPPGSGLNEPYHSNGGPVQHGTSNQGPPPLLRKESAPRVPIKLGATSGNVQAADKRPGAGEKRKSWFGKRFGKS